MHSSSYWGKTKESLLGDQINQSQSTTKRSGVEPIIPYQPVSLESPYVYYFVSSLSCLAGLACAAPLSFGVPTGATFSFSLSILALLF